jgi:hypothetical protein
VPHVSWQPTAWEQDGVVDDEWLESRLGPRPEAIVHYGRRVQRMERFERVRPARRGTINLIFTDFDGVLNDHPRGAYHLNRVMVERLNWLAEHWNAQIVVSSWWRWIGLAALRRDLAEAGLKARVIGRTPWMGETRQHDALERGIEIQAVLDYLGSRVERMVILDDHDRMGKLLPWLVQTDGYAGLTEANVAQAASILCDQHAPTWNDSDVNGKVDKSVTLSYIHCDSPSGAEQTTGQLATEESTR